MLRGKCIFDRHEIIFTGFVKLKMRSLLHFTVKGVSGLHSFNQSFISQQLTNH